MPDLRETLGCLVASFAEDIIAALRNAPLSEVMALTAEGSIRHDDGPVVTGPRRKRASPPKSAPGAADAVRVESLSVDEVERFFAERGARGATEPQVQEMLDRKGVRTACSAADLIRVLVERGVLRDAGFRRTTGTGTAPVFVLAS